MTKWMPAGISVLVLGMVFSAGPLLFQDRFLKEDGRPDKLKWAIVAVVVSGIAFAGIHAARAIALS